MAVGHREQVLAVVPASFLVGVPPLPRDFRRHRLQEAQPRNLLGAAREHPVGRLEMGVQFGLVDFPGGPLVDRGTPHAGDGESSQCLSLVAPAVQVPVVPVVGQPLRADDPARVRAPEVLVPEVNALSVDERIDDAAQVALRRFPIADGHDANPLPESVHGHTVPRGQVGDTGPDALEFLAHQAVAEALQQDEQQQQGLGLLFRQPEAGHLPSVDEPPVVEPALPDIDDRRAVFVAKLIEIPADRFLGALQLLGQSGLGDGRPSPVE